MHEACIFHIKGTICFVVIVHHQDNHAGNIAIEAIYVIKTQASREIFFLGGGVGEPITPHETYLSIKFMMHDRSQLSERHGRIHKGYRLFHIYL